MVSIIWILSIMLEFKGMVTMKLLRMRPIRSAVHKMASKI